MALQNIGTEDQAAWYEIRRNELLELLEKTSNLNISEEHAEKLAAIRKKCLENQFEIVLVGEFQGGKSTTFDTLCGGRDLSPRGLNGGGIKTSAAVISAQNISDGEEKNGMKEWAELTFKSKDELLQGMFEIIQQAAPEEFADKLDSPGSFCKAVDLDDPNDRKILQRAVEAMWGREKLDPDTADNLRIATLVLDFYGTPAYRKLCTQTIMDIYEFQKLIAFPAKWAIRWLKKRAAKFEFEEIAFVFISRVLLRIQSPDLARLGCRITDCPGLFANAYDTRVAMMTILSSDAVWYLLDGDKQIGAADLKLLREIRDLGVNDREIISANMREKHALKIAQILPETNAILAENDLPAESFPYNALLAFLAEQGKRILSGTLPAHDREIMKINSGSNGTPEQMWVIMAQDCGHAVRNNNISNLNTLNADAVLAVREESRVEGILAPISERIISEKARSILLDNGSAKAALALEKYEGDLRSTEIRAEKTEAEWMQRTEDALKTLEQFIADSTEQIEKIDFASEPINVSTLLAINLLESSVSSKSCLKACTWALVDAIEKAWENRPFLATPGAIAESSVKYAISEFSVIIARNIIGMLQSWKDNKKKSLWKEKYLDKMSFLCKDIKKKWQTEISKDELMRGIDYNPPLGESVPLDDIQLFLLANEELQNAIRPSWWTIFKVLVTLGLSKGGVGSEEWRATMAGVIEPKLRKSLRDLGNFSDLKKQLMEYFQTIFEGTLDNLKGALQTMEHDFNDRLKNAEDEWRTASEELGKIAAENHRIRTEEIEPVRKEIQTFQKQVEKELSRFERGK